MLFDVLDAVALVAKPLCRALTTQPFDERGSGAGHMLGEVYHVDAFQNDVVSLHGVRGSKGWSAGGVLWIIAIPVHLTIFNSVLIQFLKCNAVFW